MASSKPKKGFSMSLTKPKSSSSSSAAAAKGGSDRGGGAASSKSSAIDGAHDDGENNKEAGGGKRDYVTGIGGGKVVTKEVVVEGGPRVIALASNPWASNGPNVSSADPETVPPPAADDAAAKAADEPAPEKSLDQLAAEAIALESRRGDGRGDGGAADGYGLGLDSDRVIGMAGKGGDPAPPPGTAAGATPGKKRTGLLEQNMIPGLMDVDGEDAKFKHDLGHRAEDLSARSKAYVDVPVAEFGAALLRGMGWKGPEGDGGGGGGSGGTGPDLSKGIEPRHHRLGLGAQPKPPEEMKRPRKRKPGEKPRASDAERLKMWEKKMQEERSRASQSGATKPLSVMDVVELSEREGDAGGGRRPRAMVLKTQGVPGLNKISVRMEETGEKVIVDKSSAARVSEDDLARRPFADKKKPVEAEGRRRRRSSSRSRSSSASNSSSRRWQRRERDGGSSRAAPNGSARKRSRSRSSSRGSADERGGDGDERDRRKGGKKDKSSKKDKKKHKKSSGGSGSTSSSSGSKRERERNSNGRSPSPPLGRPREEGDRGSGRRRQPDREHGGSAERPPRDDKRGRREDDRDGGITTNYRKRPRDAQGNGYSGTNGHGANNSGGGGQQRPHLSAPEPQAWLRPEIRVRVVHKSYAGAYLGKGRVVDVPRIGQATVRMDIGALVLEDVKERHLETVLPARGGKVVVVRGAEKGATGKLLAKNKEKETALVQVYEDLRALTLSLDDVAEFTGALGEDVDDVGY